MGPLEPDLTATAPVLEGYGQLDWRITTTADAAQRLFTQGVLQGFAFNHTEAVRQFKAALAADAACAMCAWGVAWQLGPNINSVERDDLTEARRYVAHAQRHAGRASATERALIDAMVARYGDAPRASAADIKANGPSAGEVCTTQGGGTGEVAHPLDTLYERRMHALLQTAPNDPQVLSLWAEAALIATRKDWWNKDTGKPEPLVDELLGRLERALTVAPRHTGLNHYLVHAADSLPGAPRAVAAADRLGVLAPKSPHLLHMPAHTYVYVGRYADAARVNEQAVAADVALIETFKQQNFKPTTDWRGHNQHFLWFALLMQGRGDAALDEARAMAKRSAAFDHVYGEYLRALPLLTLVRLERWPAAIAEPVPSGSRGMAQLLGEQAQGIAQARQRNVAQARERLQRVEAAAAQVRTVSSGFGADFDKTMRAIADACLSRLRAEVALAEQRGEDAIAEQARAVSAAKEADGSEPPMLAAGALLALGDMQLALGRAADAEATFRRDLAAQPDSGWALRGLERALTAQRKNDEAAATRGKVERSWAQADSLLKQRL